MNDWSQVFLGVIALAVLVMAIIQVGMVVYGARLAQRVTRLADQVEREVTPLFEHLQTIGAEAARASALATAQVERADKLFADVSQRIEETTAIVQAAVVTPAREGAAVLSGIRAALTSLRQIGNAPRRRRTRRGDDDDPLFIG